MISRIIIAAGGTGGHIFPAIAVADELKKMNDKIDIEFIGAKGRIEENIVPKRGYKLRTLELKGFERSLNPKNLNVLFKLKRAIKESKHILKDFKPEIVFGTGGFISGPVLWASEKLRILSIIQEGNFYPGITVKLLSKKADKVIINFEGTKNFLRRQDNIEIMSYPVRENLKKYSKIESCTYFGFETNKKILFVLGGSQGANSINKVLLNNLDKLLKANIQIIWQTGKNDYDYINGKLGDQSNIKTYKFIDDIDFAFSATDLILCRSGISTVMEIAYFGLAAIFVPYPFASENHQEKNAKAFVDANAAEMVLDKDLNSNFVDKIIGIINDDKRLTEMKDNIIQFAEKNAASKIAQLLTDLVSKRLN